MSIKKKLCVVRGVVDPASLSEALTLKTIVSEAIRLVLCVGCVGLRCGAFSLWWAAWCAVRGLWAVRRAAWVLLVSLPT